MKLSLIAAIARNGVIGRAGGLPWRLPDDLANFKRLTTGHSLILGRKTWESIGHPLPKRRTLVVSTTLGRSPLPDEVRVFPKLVYALEHAQRVGDTDAFVIGGARLYEDVLDYVDVLELTRVDAEPEGDVVFPPFDESLFDRVWREEHAADERHEHAFRFERWVRR